MRRGTQPESLVKLARFGILIITILALAGCSTARPKITVMPAQPDVNAAVTGQPVALERASPTIEPRRDIVVLVTGQVKLPGKYTLPGGSHVDAAVQAANGFADFAQTRYVDVLRRSGGRVDRIRVWLHSHAGQPATDFILDDDDLILVLGQSF